MRGGCRGCRLSRALATAVAVTCFLTPTAIQAQDLPLPSEPVVVEGTRGVLQLAERRRLELNEPLALLSDVSSMDFFDDGSFVVVSAEVANVVLYDATGNQRMILGGWGPGPGEYDAPGVARVSGSSVFLRDNGQSKYMAFDTTGVLQGEWPGAPGGPHDMVVWGSWVVAFTGQSFTYLIRGFDTASGDTLAAAPSNMATSALHVVGGGGGIGRRDDRLYYVYPNENAIRTLDLVKHTGGRIDLPAKGYRSAPMEFVGREEINRSFFDGRMLRYVLQNSRTEAVRTLDDYVVAIRADGQMATQAGEQIPRNRQRVRRHFVFDAAHELVDIIEVKYDLMRRLGLNESGVDGNSFYYVVQSSADDGRTLKWTLVELALEWSHE